MTAASAPRARTYLRLGRVSNLPTVWTNALAGVVLSGARPDLGAVAALAAALSSFYVGGMFLNDAFDRAIDARERPERPIPSGHVSAAEVFVIGFCLLAVGLGAVALVAASRGASVGLVVASGVVLAASVVLYDAWHKQNPFSPVVMGACRAAVYVTAGLAAGGTASRSLLFGAAVLAAYVVGLTFVARQENRKHYRAGATLALIASPAVLAAFGPSFDAPAWAVLAAFAAWAGVALAPLFSSSSPNVPRSVVRLIAGISLVDTLALAAHGAPALAPLGVLGLTATLALQRWVRGT